jgi:hypothetical protein
VIAKRISARAGAITESFVTASVLRGYENGQAGLNVDGQERTVTLSDLSFTRIQAVVGTLAGLASITGAAFSLVQFARPANTGELVAIVQEAGTHRSVADATIEILTPQNALVATLTPDAGGRATHDLKEGAYTVRVSHPRYAAEARRIQVVARQTTEVRASMRAGSSSPVERVVSNSVNAVRKALHF